MNRIDLFRIVLNTLGDALDELPLDRLMSVAKEMTDAIADEMEKDAEQ